MEASMNVGVRPIERPQAPAVDGVGRRGDGGGSSAAFSPKTNVAIQNAVDDMAGVLAKIASNQTDAVEKMPEDLQQLIKNVMKQAFSLEETLAQGLGSTLESQRFSMEQLSSFSRMLTQMGKLMDRGMNMEVSDTMQVLLTNLKNLAGTEQGAAFEPVLITKAAFELLDNKPFTELPKEVQQLLLTLQPQGMVQPMQAGEENALGFLKQLVQYFMPRPASTGEAAQMQSNMPGQGMPQNMVQPQQGQGGVPNAGQPAGQTMPQNMAQPQQGQGNMPAQNSAQSTAPSVQAGQGNAAGQGQGVVPNAGQGMPQNMAQSQQGQGNMPAQNMVQPQQGQGNIPAQNSAQFTAPSMQAGQGNAAGQGQGGVPNAGQPAGQAVPQNMAQPQQGQGNMPAQNMAQSQQGQGNMSAQNMAQPQQGQGNMPAQNSAQSSAQPMQAGQENAVGQGQGSVSNAGQPAGQGVPQNMAQSQQGQGNMPAQNMVQPQQGQGNIPAQNSAQSSAQPMQAGQENAVGQGQGSVSNAGQPAGQGVPQNMAQSQQGQGNMPAQNMVQPQQGQGNIPAQNSAQFTAPSMQAGQGNAAGQGQGSVSNAGQPAGQGVPQNMAQPQQGQGNMSTQNMAQPQQGQGNIPVQNPAKVSGQPLQAEHNMVNGQGNVQESMAQGDHVQRPQQAAMQQAKNQLLNQVMENTPQTMNALRDLAQLLLKDGNVNQKDALLLQSFVNGKEALLSAKEAQQLQQMIRLCQANIPATVQQAALQQNIPDLPRLWAFMQLCDMAYTRNMTARQLKKAGKDVAAFVLSMRNSMEGDNSIVPGQRSLNFMMPMYMGEESTYPAYIHVYDEKQPDPETGEMKKETWLRLCVLTDNIGAVELTCRVYQENQLDMRLFFSSTETANEFRAEAEALRESLKDSKLKLKDIKIGAVGERRFM